MKVRTLLVGFLLFFLTLALHILIWRVWRPKNDLKGLLLVFFLVPGGVVLGAQVGILFNSLVPVCFDSDLPAVIVLCYSLGLAYVMSYPAAQASSPSLDIILTASKVPEGVRVEDLNSLFQEKTLLAPRFQNLIDSGLAYERSHVLHLTWQGLVLARFFRFFRRLLGLRVGEG
jgi:hypothetical protein